MIVHISDRNCGKLDPKARKFVFLGYAPTQKGYKCFDLVLKKMFVTMDVSFFETKLFFGAHLQGENKLEDSSIFQNLDVDVFLQKTLDADSVPNLKNPQENSDLF